MSTRQTVLYSLFIFFIALMLFNLGWWLKTSTELDAKTNRIEALKDRSITLSRQLNGTTNNPMLGVKPRVEDPAEGLEKKLKDLIATRETLNTSSDPGNPGMAERRAQFEALEPELKKAWMDTGAPAWQAVYDSWKKQDDEIGKAIERLRAQREENAKSVKTAEEDAAKEQDTKEKEFKKIVQERSKMDEELNAVRFEHEETSQKVREVSRDLNKVKEIVKQGTIVSADPIMRTAFIDLGAGQGVRKGQMFNIYDGSRRNTTLKGLLQVVDAGPVASKCVLLDFNREMRVDPQTGWVPTDPRFQYSPYSASGPDEQDAQELIVPKTKQDRVEGLRLEKIAREQGREAAEAARTNSNVSVNPPNDLSPSLNPIQPGDWIFNADFVPIVADNQFRAQTHAELKSMKDVNVGPMTLYVADTVRAYRKEYIRRLAERNGCRVSDSMSVDVNYVVVNVGGEDREALKQKLASTKGKEEVSAEIKSQRALLDVLDLAEKYGAKTIAEDMVESLFDERQRKLELLQGKVIQPGRRSFLIAGKTKDRTPEALAHYIEDHGGVVAKDINDKVDYVVVGVDPEKEFIDNIKKKGLKIIREEEIPEFFGEKQ